MTVYAKGVCQGNSICARFNELLTYLALLILYNLCTVIPSDPS